MKTKDIAIMGILVAVNIVLSRFLSISTMSVKIGFAFVPIVISAIALGATKTAIVGGLSDLIGALMFPIGTYFPGFTLTSLLMGFVWGFFLGKKATFLKVLVAVLINQLIFSLFLNTYWLHILYGVSLNVLGTTRLLQALVMIPIEILIAYILIKNEKIIKQHI